MIQFNLEPGEFLSLDKHLNKIYAFLTLSSVPIITHLPHQRKRNLPGDATPGDVRMGNNLESGAVLAAFVPRKTATRLYKEAKKRAAGER